MRRVRSCASAVAAIAAAALAAFPASPAAATPGDEPTSAPTSLAVSAPSAPVVARSGTGVDTWLTLTNTGTAPMDVTMRVVRLLPHDDGQLEVVDEADPTWTTHVRLPESATVPHGGQAKAPVHVDVPGDLLPDLYLVGVLVEPVRPEQRADGLKIRSQLAAVFTIEVPGARARKVDVTLGGLPIVHFGRSIEGTFTLVNNGAASAMTRGQLRVDAAASDTNLAVLPVTGERMQLLPSGTKRHVRYTWHTSDWFTLARPTAQVMYGNGGAALGEASATGRPVLLLAPEFAIALGGALLGGIAGLVWWLLSRRRRRTARAGTGPRHTARRRAPSMMSGAPRQRGRHPANRAARLTRQGRATTR